MNIPVFHDDQHGTAVISGAALLNAAHLTAFRRCVLITRLSRSIHCSIRYPVILTQVPEEESNPINSSSGAPQDDHVAISAVTNQESNGLDP